MLDRSWLCDIEKSEPDHHLPRPQHGGGISNTAVADRSRKQMDERYPVQASPPYWEALWRKAHGLYDVPWDVDEAVSVLASFLQIESLKHS